MIIELEDIEAARERIASVVNKTQLEYSRNCSNRIGTKAFLKYENEQRTGSFKIRGALNKVLKLSKEELKNGVVAASAGNHAQGVAFSASHVGAKSYVVMPEDTPHVKVQATQSYGAEVILKGQVFDESYEYARRLEKEKACVFVHPFADADVIAGQGTIGLEILEQLPDLDSIVLSIGGGGLMSGVALAIKSLKPDCKVYGVVPSVFPGMRDLYLGRELQKPKAIASIADGTAVKTPNVELYETYIKKYVDDIVEVDESSIAEAIDFLLERAKSLVEGAGALSLAAAQQADWDLGDNCCLLLSGGNMDLPLLSKVITTGLVKAKRIARICVVVDDRPGYLNELTSILAKLKANVYHVNHDRTGSHLQVREAMIEFVVETRSDEHLQEIMMAIRASGAQII